MPMQLEMTGLRGRRSVAVRTEGQQELLLRAGLAGDLHGTTYAYHNRSEALALAGAIRAMALSLEEESQK